MGFRFSKRLTIMPGVHLNLGLGGPSLSIGPRGASVNIGHNGVHGNVSIPGTGLSYRTRLDGPADRPHASRPLPDPLMMELRNGRVEFIDCHGAPIPADLRDEAMREHRIDVERLLNEHVDARKRMTAALAEMHLDTPQPARTLTTDHAYAVTKPSKDRYASQESYMEALMSWRAAKANHDASSPSFDPHGLESALSALSWPRQTDMSYAHSLDGRIVVLDVDLPEIDDMPDMEPNVSRRTLSIVEKPMSAKRLADLYSSHVASVVFRLAGTVFASSPAEEVRISGYTQRTGGTGRVEDEYIVAVTIERMRWSDIDFSAIREIDPENALRRFGLRLERTGRGALRTVEPCPGL